MKKLLGVILCSLAAAAVFWACRTTSSGGGSDVLGDLNGKRCNTAPQSPTDPADLRAVPTPYGPTCDELISAFPPVDSPDTKEDPRVLCPLLRILNRSEALVANIRANAANTEFATRLLPVTVRDLIAGARKFGCNEADCGPVAVAVSAGQSGKDPRKDKVDITHEVVDIGRLDLGAGVAHDCGFNFAYGEIQVSDKTRSDTLAMLAARAANKNGHLSFQDLMETKLANCKRDFDLLNGRPSKNQLTPDGHSLQPSKGDLVEVNLIFTYLGGVDNGDILYSDVDLFFHGNLPVNKTKYLIQQALFDHLAMVLGATPVKM